MRRAGLSLVTSRKGPAKPVAGIEDVCVLPERLPEYVAGLRRILDPLGLEASFYGHAASGELHVRPVLDLHRPEDITKLREVADEVSELCRLFKGSLAAEHGVGMARAEYLEAHIGPDLMAASLELKALFDPGGIMNPGKIFGDGGFRIDRDLRLGTGSEIKLPFAEAFDWVGRDDGFVANLEQCNGCGGCRKDAADHVSDLHRYRRGGPVDPGQGQHDPRRPRGQIRRSLHCCRCRARRASWVPVFVQGVRHRVSVQRRHGQAQGRTRARPPPPERCAVDRPDDRIRGSTGSPGDPRARARQPACWATGRVRRMLQALFGFDTEAPLPPFAGAVSTPGSAAGPRQAAAVAAG